MTWPWGASDWSPDPPIAPGGSYFRCRKCRAVHAYVDVSGRIYCWTCKEYFHPDFRSVVQAIPTVPEPPRS